MIHLSHDGGIPFDLFRKSLKDDVASASDIVQIHSVSNIVNKT
ncbi:hypothetical protein [Mammaliicoccus lentus]